jgi:glycerate kinase
LGAGLVAFLGARIRPGFDVVAEALGLAGALADADVAVTGEGRFDEQTERGKAPRGVLRMAREAGCRRVVICGQVADAVRPDADVVVDLSARWGVDDAKARAEELVEEAAAGVAAEARR